MDELIKRISPSGQHCFYGYYDLPAWSHDERLHLAHRVSFTDRIPEADDRAEVGYLKLEDEVPLFYPVSETTAWNFQQGSMLQWLPGQTGTMIFNQRSGNSFHGVIYDTAGKCLKKLPVPIANVDPRGRFAMSISFPRMMAFRPGYGYVGVEDLFQYKSQPEGEGIMRIDFDAKSAELILSLADLGELCRPYFGKRKLLVNHLNLNPSGTRFIALVRHFPDVPNGPFKTIAVTANADGSDPYILWDGGVASHYHWRDDTCISMVIKDASGLITLAEFQDKQPGYTLVDPGFFLDDGHQSYSPDRNWLLYDSYPKNGLRDLYLYDLFKKKGQCLRTLKSEDIDTPVKVETRCDLHPRWSPAGDSVSFDSIHEGYRGIYVMDLKPFLRT